MGITRASLEKKMKKELMGQHMASMTFIALGIAMILVLSLIMLFAYEQQTELDLCMYPCGLIMGAGLILFGGKIWHGPLSGLPVEEKYKRIIAELEKVEENKERSVK